MKTIFTTTLSILLCAGSYAQNKNFDAALIPEELKKNAYSVVREEQIEFAVKDQGKAIYTVHSVVTVLDEKGRGELQFEVYTDKFRLLESAAIQFFDSKGVSIKKYKRSDLSNQIYGSGLVPDGKLYFMVAPVSSYPITIQIDYEIKYSAMLRYPKYEIQKPKQSVENSTYVSVVPSDLDLRFKEKNVSLKPVISNDTKNRIYTWSVKNLPALNYESGSLGSNSGYPHILLAPNKFEMGGYTGELNTWQNFGKWGNLIAKNTNNLTEERKQFFKELVKGAPNDREKVKIIYKYLQSNCRYVSIQLGMGGLIPFEADFVDKKKYGDCKALSNYTLACLDAVGIRSHYAWINSDYNEEPVDPSFPYDGFNHAILCVPMQRDSIWLECTSNTNEFGVLGNFTENRYALLMAEDGGKLVPTPKSKASDNILCSNTLIQLSGDASGQVDIKLNTTGEYKDMLNYMGSQKKDDQKYMLVNYLGYKQPDDFEINNEKTEINTSAKLRLEISKVPDFSAGSKMFLNPRVYKIWNDDLPKTEYRTQDYYFKNPYIKTDTTIYKLPEGYGIESLPKAKNLTFEYGNFTSSYIFDEAAKTVMSVAKLELDEYKIPAAKFTAMRNFFNDVSGEYAEKIVIKKL